MSTAPTDGSVDLSEHIGEATEERESALNGALYWAGLGVPVLICDNRSRAPVARFCPHGVKSATANLAVLRQWFGHSPFALIGIALGEASGMVAVDVDTHPGRPNGFKTLVDLGVDLEAISPYWETTPTGGAHYLFRYAGEANAIWPGIELRSTGLYICTYPSGGYLWQGPPLTDLGHLPPLLEAFSRPVRAHGARKTGGVEGAPDAPPPLPQHLIDACKKDAGKGVSTDGADTLEDFMKLPLIERIRMTAFAMAQIPNEYDDRDEWLGFVFSIYDATDGNDGGLEIARIWSRQWSGHTFKSERHLNNVWRHQNRSPRTNDPDRITYRTLLKEAYRRNPLWRMQYEQRKSSR
jgi:hypothetical protein